MKKIIFFFILLILFQIEDHIFYFAMKKFQVLFHLINIEGVFYCFLGFYVVVEVIEPRYFILVHIEILFERYLFGLCDPQPLTYYLYCIFIWYFLPC